MSMNARALGPFVLSFTLVGVLLIAGCETHESGTVRSETLSSKVRTTARISQQDLAAAGFEEIWYNHPQGDNPVNSVYLQRSGLFVATLPSSREPARLKLIKRKDGFTSWYYDLEAPLEHAPSVYRYSTLGPNKYHEVFFPISDTVHCLTLDFGDPLWKTAAPFSVSTSVVADESGYVAGSDSGRVYGVAKNSSFDTWTYRTGGHIEASPVTNQTSTFVGSSDGTLYRFSTNAGYRQGFSWSFPTGAPIVAAPVAFSQWVLVPSTDYKLYCLAAGDGSPVWEFLAEAPIVDAPVVYSFKAGQEFVFVISEDRVRKTRRLFCVRLRDGEAQWEFPGVRKVVSLGRNTLYVLTGKASTGQRALVALDRKSGKEKSRLAISNDFRFVPTNHANAGRDRHERGRIYLVSGNGAVQAIAEK